MRFTFRGLRAERTSDHQSKTDWFRQTIQVTANYNISCAKKLDMKKKLLVKRSKKLLQIPN